CCVRVASAPCSYAEDVVATIRMDATHRCANATVPKTALRRGFCGQRGAMESNGLLAGLHAELLRGASEEHAHRRSRDAELVRDQLRRVPERGVAEHVLLALAQRRGPVERRRVRDRDDEASPIGLEAIDERPMRIHAHAPVSDGAVSVATCLLR